MKKIIILLTITTSTCIPADMTSSNPISPAVLSKALPALKTGAYVAALTIPFWTRTVQSIKERRRPLNPNLDPGNTLTDFVNHECSKVGVKKKIPVQMNGNLEEGTAVAHGPKIYLGYNAKDGTSNLEALLNERMDVLSYGEAADTQRLAEINKELAWYRAMIQHEAGHIKSRDSERDIALELAAPFAIHGVLKASNAKSFLGKAALGILGWFTAKQLLALHSKYREFRADDNIQDDPVLIQAAIEHFKKHDAKKRKEFLKLYTGTSDEELNRFPYSLFYAGFHKGHPVPLKRVERLEKRLAKLNRS